MLLPMSVNEGAAMNMLGTKARCALRFKALGWASLLKEGYNGESSRRVDAEYRAFSLENHLRLGMK